MNKILRFLYDHFDFIFFLILEILAFILVINKNALQQSVAFRIGTNITAYCYKVTSSIGDYFSLKGVNEQLALENSELRNHISQLESTIQVLVDTLEVPQCDNSINYIKAKVVFNSVYDLQNYIILDKGSEQGISPDMGVISPQGVVGVVQRVSKNFSVVLPLINPDQVISVRIKNSNDLGSVVWGGTNPRKAELKEIPNHVDLVKGDSIVTSGFSAIFPEGEFVGTVVNVMHNKDEMFSDVEIDLAVDFQTLSHVSIAAYRGKQELSNLQNGAENEE